MRRRSHLQHQRLVVQARGRLSQKNYNTKVKRTRKEAFQGEFDDHDDKVTEAFHTKSAWNEERENKREKPQEDG
ncbi:hypothetical protein B9479_008258 [Cryptococcus floricola]|uniref:Uncharacterized protein n=1 Tax=Cryptococcus floricola TaxID=2591691 RepID=A0A5D3AHX9_9TREE|nr:hypothetical protein B9479_008258 [Cryptococcus floricola]